MFNARGLKVQKFNYMGLIAFFVFISDRGQAFSVGINYTVHLRFYIFLTILKGSTED
jgi:hypothetical protein